MTPPLDCTRTVNLCGRSHLQISQVHQSACDHHYLFCKLMISSRTELSKHIHLLCNLYIIIVFFSLSYQNMFKSIYFVHISKYPLGGENGKKKAVMQRKQWMKMLKSTCYQNKKQNNNDKNNKLMLIIIISLKSLMIVIKILF